MRTPVMVVTATAVLMSMIAGAQGQSQDRDAARKILQSVVEIAPSAHPEIALVAMMRAGMTYGSLEREKGLELLQRAFSSLPAIADEEVRDEYATAIVRAAVELDVTRASELLRQVRKPAVATTDVVRRLLSERKYDASIELISLLPESARYPFEAASHVIASLPKEDARRPICFGRATAAFARNPDGAFPAVVERFGADMPAELRNRAVSALLTRIQDWKDSSSSFSGTTDGKDDIEVHSPEQYQLRELVAVARKFDAAAVDRILLQRPDIGAALAGFRKERKTAEPLTVEPAKQDDQDLLLPPFGIGMGKGMEDFQRRINEYVRASNEAEKIGPVMKKDPVEAVAMARRLPVAVRAEALAAIAESVLSKDPALATSVLDSCSAELARVPDPAMQVGARVKLGVAYAGLKDSARAWAAFEEALRGAVALWARDTRAEMPNRAARDTWPSVQAARTAAHEAARTLGASADGLLANVTVPDLVVLARLQMARALLGLGPEIRAVNVKWTEEAKR